MALFGGITLPGHIDLENVRRLDLIAVPAIRRCHRLGFAIDVPYCNYLSDKFLREMGELEKDIASYIPPEKLREFAAKGAGDDDDDDDDTREDATEIEFNAASAEQIGKLLFDVLGVGASKQLKRTKNGDRISTGKAQLRDLELEHPVVPLILAYRERAKLRGTYAEALPKIARFHPRGGCCPVCEMSHAADTWRVHTEIVQTRAATGRMASRRPNCFSGDTEVLTRNGWVRFDNLPRDYKTEVAQWRETGTIEFAAPTGYMVQHSTDVYDINTRAIDLRVTGDHRCLLQHRKTGVLKVVKAAAYPEDWKQLHAGTYSSEYGCGLSDSMIRFMLALQADGSWKENGQLDFSFKQLRKIKRFDWLLDDLGIAHTKSFDKKTNLARYYIPNCDFLRQLREEMGKDKLFSWATFLSMSAHEIEVVTEEVMHWDGCFTTKNDYCSKHKHNCDVISTMFSLSGRRAVVVPQTNNGGREYWHVYVTKNRDYSLTTNRTVEPVKKGAFVYCLSVPSSYILVRRNGKTMITGQCQNIPQRTELGSWVRAAFMASPGCMLVSCDFSQIELRMMAHLANCRSMIDVYLADGDIHVTTAMQCFDIDDPKKLDKISHRIPSKTANFLCIARGQRVLTNRGLVAIQNVTCHDRVWDGVDWVRHDGLVFKGYKNVITYDGLTATADHEVWADDGTKTTLEQVRRRGARLAITGTGEVPIRFIADCQQSDNAPKRTYGSGSVLRSVQTEQDTPCREYRTRENNKLSMSRTEEVHRSSGQNACLSIFSNLTALHKPHPPKLPQLWWAWDQMLLQVCKRIRSICFGEAAARELQGARHWTKKQRRALQEGEYPTRNSVAEFTQQTHESVRNVQAEKDNSQRSSRHIDAGCAGIPVEQRTDDSISCRRSSLGRYCESETARSIQEDLVPVYDLLNAGPRHRFTVEGKLVSNCMYGGSGKALYAQLLMAMLILISEKKLDRVPEWLTVEWCDQFNTMWFDARPEVREYLELQTYRARRYGKVWDLTGRPRLVPEIRSYHPWIKSAGERQGGNMADQGTSSAFMKLAMGEIDEQLTELREGGGMWCWPLLPVHDQMMIEVEEKSADDVLEMVAYTMDNVPTDKETGENLLRVPIKSDGEVIPRWIKPEEHVWNENTRMLDRVVKNK